MQDRLNETGALIGSQERFPSKSEEAGVATARALKATASYIRRGAADLAAMALRAGVEGAKVTGKGVWGFSKGFVAEARGSERLR